MNDQDEAPVGITRVPMNDSLSPVPNCLLDRLIHVFYLGPGAKFLLLTPSRSASRQWLTDKVSYIFCIYICVTHTA